MNTRTLDMLHNSGNENVGSVRNGIYFQFRSHEIFIAQYGIFYPLRENDVHIAADVLLRKGNRHILSADDVRRTKQDGIFQLFRRGKRFLFGHDGNRLGTGNGIFFEQRFKAFPVLRNIHAVRRGSENADSVSGKITAKIDGGLPAECNDDTVRLFHVDDVLYILGRQRLEIQPVRGIEVRRDGLGVIIDDDDFITEFL